MKRKAVGTLFLLLAASGLAPASLSASSLRADVLYQLPAESGQVGFIDLQSVRGSPHYALLKERLLPPRFVHFERFIASLGVNVDVDLEWLAWALVPPGPENPGELFLGLAQGQFAPEAVERIFAEQKLSTADYNGLTLFPFGSGGDEQVLHFVFLDSSTAAFGTRRSLELLLDTRLGARDNLLRNELLLDRIREANGRVPVWAALDEHYTRLAVRQLVPEAARFPEFTGVAERFRSSLLQVSVEREVTLSFQAWCAEPADAQTFSLIMQAGLVAQSWQVANSNPALSAVLGRAEVHSSGERLELRLAIAGEDVQALLRLR